VNGPRVFIPEANPRYDVTPAKKFGDVFPILASCLSVFNLVEAYAQIERGLIAEQFNPATDYICLSGNPPILAVFTSVASRLGKGTPLNVLVFDARSSGYRKCMLPT
jgi:hypothetical protein